MLHQAVLQISSERLLVATHSKHSFRQALALHRLGADFLACLAFFVPKAVQATVASAQLLVADPHSLRFEGASATPDGGDRSAAITTPTAASGGPIRRSWINGYQLFTKVNHPRFRE